LFLAEANGDNASNTAVGTGAIINTTALVTGGTIIGHGAKITGNNSTALGDAASVVGSFGTAIGSGATAGTNSTAIGAGATTSGENQIVLGTSIATVYCPGTSSTTSLVATKNIMVNGISVGIGSNAIGDANIYIGRGNGGDGAGSNNTIVGRNSYSALATAGIYNTYLGAGSGINLTSLISQSTIIGGNCYTSGTSYNNVSCLGYNCQIGGANSTAIGYNAATTIANQISLGSNADTVYCHGVPSSGTVNTCLVLASGLQLQTSYPAEPTANMLGYSLSTTTLLAVITGATGGVPLNVLSVTIPTIGIYLCEASIYYSTNTANYYVFCSISTTSATANSNNKNNVFTSAAVQTNQIVRTTGVITTTSINTVLYAVGQSGFASQTIASGILKFTRIA
jgi:hypothetical protein